MSVPHSFCADVGGKQQRRSLVLPVNLLALVSRWALLISRLCASGY
jgi:hypothetical protein